jgi:pimeloyl-ACP methyl ester carboxylesterase
MSAVLVHGAWHGAWCWDGVVAELERRGVAATAVELPLTGLADDIAAARAAIGAAGEGCVVVGHSYGGQVITAAAAGLPVARLVYLAAFLTEPAEDVMALLGDSALMASLLVDEGGLHVRPDAARDVFYADAPPDVAAAAVARLRPMPLGAEPAPSTDVAWRTIPSTYVVCTNDQALPPGSQRSMARRATDVVEWPTDHSPFLTRPGDVADLVIRSIV